VRLRSSASAYFNRTPASASNQKTWTWSGWVKRGNISSMQTIFSAYNSSTGNFVDFGLFTPGSSVPAFWCRRYNSGAGTNTWVMESTSLYRDPSAWYHVVFHLNCTSSPTFRAWINGVELTTWTQNSPPSNSDWEVNGTNVHYLGSLTTGQYFDGYLTEINFIDGQQLTPASFGYTDTATGVWQPAPYNGTYGANGFYLNFKDPTSTTTIAYDYSGNSNNWTANNISVTAGTTYDSMVDVPINWGTDTGVGGSVRGNYPTFNPIDVSTGSPAQTITQGNLTLFSSSTTRIDGAYSTMAVSSGKWYVEMTLTTRTNDYPTAGWGSTSFDSTGSGWQWQAGGSSNTPGACVDPYGRLNCNATTNGPVGGYFSVTWAQGDIIQVAVDIDNKLIWFGKAGSWSGTAGNMNGNPATGTNGTSFAAQGGTTFKFQSCIGDSAKGDVNFGQRAFSYTAPSGFKALCSQNMSVPTILNGANYMAATLYTGNGGTLAVSNGANNTIGTTFQPDMVWIKSRSAATDNKLTDSVRGVTKAIISNTTGAETTDTNGLTVFGSSGFTVGTDTVYNNSGATYVGWQWKGGGTAVTNTAGSITSSVSANTTAGFSVVTWTATGANATVGHGLGVSPSMIILKPRSQSDQWPTWINTFAVNEYVYVNLTNAKASLSTFMNGTLPSSSVVSLGTWSSVGTNNVTMVMYCFAAISGYSAFGSYTGNGSTDGPFAHCGFRPRFLLMKRSDSTGSWYIWDTARSTYNQMTLSLDP
jgi:hypothetical protein